MKVSPGRRAAIGFLKVLRLFALLWYAGAILALGVSCLAACAESAVGSDSLRFLVHHSVVIAAVVCGYSLRTGCHLMAEIMEDDTDRGRSSQLEMLQAWSWGIGRCAAGVGAAGFAVVALLSCFVASESGLQTFPPLFVASATLSVACWIGFTFLYRKGIGSQKV